MTPLPLSGVRILDAGHAWALPYAITPLAMYGAEVLKVESTVRPDMSRGSPQPENRVVGDSWNHGGSYHEMNRNKLGVTLDLTTPRGKEIYRELVSISDVVAQNFPPRVMRNFGLDYPNLRKIRPDIIVLDSTAYGSTGPWQNYIGYGSSLQAVTGLTYVTGYEGEEPIQGGILFNDVLAALAATYAILLALAHREVTGEGQWIDLSQYELGVTHLGEAFMEYAMNGRVPTRRGNSHPHFAPYGVYPCADEDAWVAITVTSDGEWLNFRDAVGEEWAYDPVFETVIGRLRHRKRLDALLAQWTRPQDHHTVMHRLQAAGVACGAVLNARELVTDPHLRDRGFFTIMEHPAPVGRRPHLGPLFRLLGVQRPPDRPAPSLGQHNGLVLRDLLGVTPEEYRALEEAGVIGEAPVKLSVAQPASAAELLRLGFIAEHDTQYRERLGLGADAAQEERG